ncbi:hypothetical protein Hanom_Chr16g01513041 [Helianthus anomalus]
MYITCVIFFKSKKCRRLEFPRFSQLKGFSPNTSIIYTYIYIEREAGYCTNFLNVRCVRDAVSTCNFFLNMRFWFSF